MPRVPDAYGPPTCMTIIEPTKTASKGIEVLLAVDKTVLVIDLTGKFHVERMCVCMLSRAR